MVAHQHTLATACNTGMELHEQYLLAHPQDPAIHELLEQWPCEVAPAQPLRQSKQRHEVA